MTRRHISSGSRFEAEIGYSRAVVDGDHVWVSGTTGYDYAAMTIADDVVAQAEQCFRNIAAALAEAGASLDDVVRDAVDKRPLERTVTTSEVRRDPLLGDSVAVASHRQGRTYHPPADECPLCPSEGDRLSEIPDSSYDVVVFENRFPSLAGDSGRCEVVCFTSDHNSTFADLTEEQTRLVLEAWTDRTSELSHLPAVEQVFCFENRGAEIGVTQMQVSRLLSRLLERLRRRLESEAA